MQQIGDLEARKEISIWKHDRTHILQRRFFFWWPLGSKFGQNMTSSAKQPWLCCRRVLLGLSEKGKPSFPLVNWFIIIIITVPKIILLITYTYIYIHLSIYIYIFISIYIYIYLCHIAPLHRMCTCKICIYINIYIYM